MKKLKRVVKAVWGFITDVLFTEFLSTIALVAAGLLWLVNWLLGKRKGEDQEDIERLEGLEAEDLENLPRRKNRKAGN